MIETTPAVKSQSGSAAPGIATAPRSVVQVPMTMVTRRSSLGQTEGDSLKKDHTDPERWIMTLGVSSGGTADAVYGFSDEETEEVSLVVDSTEDDLEGTG